LVLKSEKIRIKMKGSKEVSPGAEGVVLVVKVAEAMVATLETDAVLR
jgi:hypothetical protein